MKRKILIISMAVFFISMTSCTAANPASKPRQEVSSYEEKIVDADLPLQLDLKCDYGEIEVYSWDKRQVKFEITRRIRGTETKDRLAKKLDKISIGIDKKDKVISLVGKCGLWDADYPDFCMTLRIYIPKRTVGINFNLKKGNMLFLDDMKCNMNIAAGSANLEVNSLEGRVNYTADEGWVRISAGELDTDSGVRTGKGNIDIRAKFKEGGNYVLDTGSGMIRLELPKDFNAAFEYSGGEENMDASDSTVPARFKLKSGMGKIEIVRVL